MRKAFKSVSKKFGNKHDESAASSKSRPASNQPKAAASRVPEPPLELDMPQGPPFRRTEADIARIVQLMGSSPRLKDTSLAKRQGIFIQKLKLCEYIFNFEDPTSEQRGKALKREILLELVDFVNTSGGSGKLFNEETIPAVVSMVSANIFRALPAQQDDFDAEEDEPVLEPAWPHYQVVYEFLLRFVVSSDVTAKVAKKHVNQLFCLNLVTLFNSEDPRERDYLKTILHRVYGKFMTHRAFIRRTIANVFYTFIYETSQHNGIGELLEILGSIINGFAMPLKKEHVVFLERALTPLHKPVTVSLYHQQLSYCITQYVEKDPNTGIVVITGMCDFWPWTCTGKQVLFLNELEEILELITPEQLEAVGPKLFHTLALCVGSPHFQVAERALFLWNNEHLVNVGCLSRQHANVVLPAIYPALYRNASGHWNSTVEGLTQNVLKMYMDYDIALFDKCQAEYLKTEKTQQQMEETKKRSWGGLQAEAGPSKTN